MNYFNTWRMFNHINSCKHKYNQQTFIRAKVGVPVIASYAKAYSPYY